MPQRTACRDCGFILYEDIDLKSPDEIIEAYDGRCPKCGKKLNFIPDNVYIKPAEKESKTIPLPSAREEKKYIIIEGRRYDVPSLTKLTIKESSEEIEANFLEAFCNRFNEVLKKFDLYNISEEIPRVGAFRKILWDELISIWLSLDAEHYHHVKHAIKVDFKTGTCTYYERENPILDCWKEKYPKEVSLDSRIEYQTKLKNKFKILEELLEERTKTKSKQTE